jgi:hypothetical protein
VKASMDWETCPGRIVPSEDIPVLDNCFAIFYYKYCKFKLTIYYYVKVNRSYEAEGLVANASSI